jgi:hypothetical protein
LYLLQWVKVFAVGVQSTTTGAVTLITFDVAETVPMMFERDSTTR